MSVRPLTKELQQKAIEELNEDPKRIKEDLKYIKTWLSKQPHLNAQTDDQFLIYFLRGCKYSLERTKEKLDMHYTLKTLTPELYDNRDPMLPEIQRVLSLGVFLPLPKVANPAAPRISIFRHSVADVNKVEQTTLFKIISMIVDVMMLEDDNVTIAGSIGIQDMGNITMSYGLSMSPTLIKKAMTCFQQGYPLRIKEIHFFNTSTAFEIIYNLFQSFLSDKLKSRVHVHSKFNDMSENVPKSILPEEYGGNGGKVEDITMYWKNKLESYRDWFLENANYRSNEKKRPGKPKTSESIFGIDGSFRQLSVD